uniref:Uncharacterized protein n=1 Tax=Timema monikensis TaxID=170555 RepID=A0A7R9E4U2_9NEOP|nr:unnamed protein product [Timema monikensis]
MKQTINLSVMLWSLPVLMLISIQYRDHWLQETTPKIQTKQQANSEHDSNSEVSGDDIVYPDLPENIHRMNTLCITITKGLPTAIAATRGDATVAIYPAGFIPPSPAPALLYIPPPLRKIMSPRKREGRTRRQATQRSNPSARLFLLVPLKPMRCVTSLAVDDVACSILPLWRTPANIFQETQPAGSSARVVSRDPTVHSSRITCVSGGGESCRAKLINTSRWRNGTAGMANHRDNHVEASAMLHKEILGMPIDKTILDNCGAPSPLFRLTTHLTSDQAHRDQGFGLPYSHEVDISNMSANDMAQEFLERQAPLHPSFRMDTLLHEIRAIELPRHGPIQGPGVAELATAGTWEMTHDWTEIKNVDPANAMARCIQHSFLLGPTRHFVGYGRLL